jgi:1-deoxy-D-xylulose-5-phosphate synthase
MMGRDIMSIIETIDSYRDLSALSPEQLKKLCDELRERIINVVLDRGGHLASSLGAVELIVGLLRVFDPGEDRIIFDVGHQTYAYKILTGRDDVFNTLRTWGGISGFPKHRESRYDHFDVGHSSTSISAGLGYAKARDLKAQNHEVVAFIGDGALLNGLALEALNNVKAADTKLIVVLNDNEWSINRKVGGMAESLARMRSHSSYRKLKAFIKEHCRNLPAGEEIESFLARGKDLIKSVLQPANFFEELDISYWGPFDGHDLEDIETVLTLARRYDKSVVVHFLTEKGRGYKPAEEDPTKFHGVSCKPDPCALKQEPKPSWSAAVCDILCERAAKDSRVVALTAAMMEGSKLNAFQHDFPARFFDVGIAEGHLLTFAAGLAAGGLRPVATIYATFLQRAMDQLVEDIAMQGHPVIVAVDRAGLVGEDGETHHGLLDVSWGRSVPGLCMMAPRDIIDLRAMFDYAFSLERPSMIRYSRGNAPFVIGDEERPSIASGKAQCLVEGTGVLLIGYGSTIPLLLEARKHCIDLGLPGPAVVDLRFLKPLDWESLALWLPQYDHVLTVEECYASGSIGEVLSARIASEKWTLTLSTIAVPDAYIPQGTRKEQWEHCGLSVESIVNHIVNCHGPATS